MNMDTCPFGLTKLRLMNIPETFDTDLLRLLFEGYGTVLDIVLYEGGLGFVQMNTKKNCHRAYEGLKTNDFGIIVERCPHGKSKITSRNKTNMTVGRTKLRLTTVPENIDVGRLTALFGAFGCVRNVLLRDGLAYVEMETRKECQRAFEGLKTNGLGITVEKCPKNKPKETTSVGNINECETVGGRTMLRLMKIPENMDVGQLKSLCEAFGSVSNVELLDDGFAYVDMATAKDCQQAFEGLKANDFGLTVDICPRRKFKKAKHSAIRDVVGERMEYQLMKVPGNVDVERHKSCDSFGNIRNVVLPEDGLACVEMDARYCQLDSKGLISDNIGMTSDTCSRRICEEKEPLINTTGAHIVTGRTKLRLSNVPENVDADQLKLLCQAFGRVLNVVMMEEGLAYVEMETKKKCRSASKGLKTNHLGIKVERCPKARREQKETDDISNMDHRNIFSGESKLRLREIPANVDVDQIKFLCQTFGRVLNVLMLEGGLACVHMQTRRDCTLALKGLQTNDLGIIVERCLSPKQARKKQRETEHFTGMSGNDIHGTNQLRLTKVPENFDIDELRSLFEAFGSVRNVVLQGDGIAYVQMEKKKGCKRACEGLKTNDLGITVEKCLSVKEAREHFASMDETGAATGRIKLRLTKVPHYIGVGQLRLLCECFGSVHNVVLLEDGLAFVEMDSETDCQQALEGFKINDLGITVESCISLDQAGEKQRETDYFTIVDDMDIVTGRTKLRLTNVPENIGVGQLKSLCESYGSVRNVVLLEDGLAYVEMDTRKNCERALKGLNASNLGIAAEKCAVISNEIRKKLAEAEDYLNEIGVLVGTTKLRLVDVPQNIDADRLTLLCQAFGRVLNIVFKDDGVAYVEMDTKGNCKRAFEGIKANDIGVTVERCPSLWQMWFQQKEVECIPKKNGIGVVGRQKLRLTDVPEHVDADQLRSLFETFGSVFTVVVQKGGFAYVEMDSNMNCQRAYEGLKVNNLGITVERCLSKWQIWKKQFSCASVAEIISFCCKPPEAIDVGARGKESVEPLEWRRESAEKKLLGLRGVSRKNEWKEEPEWRRTSAELQSSSKLETENTTGVIPETAGANSSEVMFHAEQQMGENGTERGIHSVFIDWEKKIPKHVYITGYGGTKLLWVRSLEYELNEAYMEIVDKVNALGRSAEPLEMLPSIGDFVIANYGYKSFCRAVVVNVIHAQNIIVKFLDYGSMRTKTLRQLRKYPEKDLWKTDNLICPIQLFRVPYFKPNFEALNLLNSYIRNSTEFELFCRRRTSVREYILEEVCTGESVNELLRDIKCRIDEENEIPTDNLAETSSSQNLLSEYNTGYVKNEDVTVSSDSSTNIPQNDKHELESDSSNQNGYVQADREAKCDDNVQHPPVAEIVSELVFSQDIQWEMLPNDDYIPVYIADNSFLKYGVVSCINLKKLEMVKQFRQEFDDYARTMSEIYTPRISEICLALNEDDQKWYRAELVENINEDLKLKFIDLGCIKNVQRRCIRKYPRELLRPCHTSTCVIQGLPRDMDENFISFLRKSFRLGSKLILDRVETVPHLRLNFVHIDLSDTSE